MLECLWCVDRKTPSRHYLQLVGKFQRLFQSSGRVNLGVLSYRVCFLMENSSHNYVRIDNAKFGNRGIIYTATVFVLSFIICCIIGSTGPDVIQIRNDGKTPLPVMGNGIAEWHGVLEDMTPLNQLFWLSVRIYRSTEDNTDEEVGELETW